VRRREFITLLGGAAAWPLGAHAEVSSKRPVIAWLSGGTAQFSAGFVDNFLRGMRDLGYVERRNLDMVYRFTDGYGDRLPVLTDEVVRLKPDVILASAIIAAVAARKATATIPIVSPALADAVHPRLIASEARPGGNVTEIEPYVEGLPAKQIEFAREILPSVRTIGLLTKIPRRRRRRRSSSLWRGRWGPKPSRRMQTYLRTSMALCNCWRASELMWSSFFRPHCS
jgi:putative ABC transport system substrate-binding protein